MNDDEKACLGIGLVLGFILMFLIITSIEAICGHPLETATNNGWFSYGGKYYTVQQYGPVTNNPPKIEKEIGK